LQVVCCSVCVPVCVLQCLCVLQVVCCSVLQCKKCPHTRVFAAVCCSVLQRVAVCSRDISRKKKCVLTRMCVHSHTIPSLLKNPETWLSCWISKKKNSHTQLNLKKNNSHVLTRMYVHSHTTLSLLLSIMFLLSDRSFLQNIVSFIGLFCKSDL